MGQHFVPQRYLRNFEDPSQPGLIWLHDKRGGPAHRIPILKVAQAKGFYSAETETSLVSEVETPGNAVIQKLIGNMAITPVERLQLTYYIGVMLKRIPARRRRSEERMPIVLANSNEACADDFRASVRSHARIGLPALHGILARRISAGFRRGSRGCAAPARPGR